MNLIFRRRLRRLEKRVAFVVAERKRKEPEERARLYQVALSHATKLVTLILHGDPQIDEPLAIAWERARSYLGLSGTPEELFEYQRFRIVVVDPRGDPEIAEIAKFAHIFRSAPSWLLDFCYARLDCVILGIELSESSEPAPEYGRDGLREACNAWPELPKGTIGAGPPMPKLNPFRKLSREEMLDHTCLQKKGQENWSRRDRQRHSEILAEIDCDAFVRGFEQLYGPFDRGTAGHN
jgi:hypothetical protein